MTLSQRIAAREPHCAVVGCGRSRVTGSLFCRDDLNEMWANRLRRQPDGSYVPTRFLPKDLSRSAA